MRLEEITFNRENVNNHYDQRLKILVSRNVLHENYVNRHSLLSRQGARFLSGESMTLESKRNMFKKQFKNSKSEKLLGITIDEKLTFNEHIGNL